MQIALYNRLYFIIAPILLGSIAVFSQPPYFVLPCILLAFGGLYKLITQEKRLAPAVLTIFLFVFGYYVANFYWFYPYAKLFLSQTNISYGSAAALGFALASILPSLIISAIALVCFWCVSKHFKHTFVNILMYSVLVTVSEVFRGFPYTYGSPWGLSIYSITNNLALSQIAALPYGLWIGTALIIAISASIFTGHSKHVLSGIIIFCTWLCIGFFSVQEDSAETDTLHLRIVQINAPAFHGSGLNRLKQLINVSNDPGLDDRDAVMWPENSTPVLIRNIQRSVPKPVIGGATLMMPSLPEDRLTFYNTIGILSAGPYQNFATKVIRVPFGEYVPSPFRGVRFLPLINIHLAETSNPKLTVAGTSITAINCYEVLYHGFVREQSQDADIIYVTGNDNIMSAAAPRITATMPYIARLRAIENRKPLVRNANSGLVSYIDAYGRFILNEAAEFPTAYDIDVSYPLKAAQ